MAGTDILSLLLLPLSLLLLALSLLLLLLALHVFNLHEKLHLQKKLKYIYNGIWFVQHSMLC